MLKYFIIIKRTDLMDIYLCIAGAALSGLAFISDSTYFMLLIAPAFFYLSLLNEKRPFLKGVIFGAVFYSFNSFFISSLDVAFYTASPSMQRLLPFIAYLTVISIESVFAGIFSYVFVLIKKNTGKKSHPLIFASIWVLYEFFIGLSFSDAGYNWGRISVPLAAHPEFIQTASLFGMLLISFTIIYFASSLAMSYREKSFKYIVFPCVFLALNIFISLYLYSVPEKGETITVKCVQSGYGGYEKRHTPVSEIAGHVISETNDANLILFPECIVPATLNKTDYINKISSAAKDNSTTVLLGALYAHPDGKTYTSIYSFPYNDGELYHKRHLVPYGEYYPILDIFSEEAKESGYAKGKESKILGKYKAGPVICFDSIFPIYAREAVKGGARILCISTNDSWFSKGNAAKLHLYHSVYRAIENGRYASRSACTGISAVIDSKGNIKSFIPLNETGSITEEVLLLDETTPYTLWGDAPIILYALSVISISLFKEKRRRKK